MNRESKCDLVTSLLFVVRKLKSLCCVTGETIKIVIEDYVQHLSGYHFKLKFDPELLFNQQFQYQNRIASEFNTLYHWHPLLPDTFNIEDQEYSFKQFLYNNSWFSVTST